MDRFDPAETTDLPLVELIRDPKTALAILKPPRTEILAALRDADSASGLARRLELPRQRLNHHMRALEDVGLLRLFDERRRRGCVERVLRATARHYLLSPEVLGDLGAIGDADAESLGTLGWLPLMAMAGQAIHDLVILRDWLGDEVPALTLPAQIRFAKPSAFNDFIQELSTEISRLRAKYNDESGSATHHRFFLAAYPAVPASDI